MSSIISLIMAIISVFGLYPKTGFVTEIEDHAIVIEDATGNLWAFESDPGDWEIGDGVSLIMHDNGTEIIYDDTIVAIRYNGFIR